MAHLRNPSYKHNQPHRPRRPSSPITRSKPQRTKREPEQIAHDDAMFRVRSPEASLAAARTRNTNEGQAEGPFGLRSPERKSGGEPTRDTQLAPGKCHFYGLAARGVQLDKERRD
ncbi:hypothetical protein ACRALDRAFT_1081097 [Sodiomyces alcalophilus JCM 7366]|uniref:uncharacterized protein n=1 Tax=Sodiomyces alcalophilus JCM 7366 TaxID=591952 RepID=UPI0039B53152